MELRKTNPRLVITEPKIMVNNRQQFFFIESKNIPEKNVFKEMHLLEQKLFNNQEENKKNRLIRFIKTSSEKIFNVQVGVTEATSQLSNIYDKILLDKGEYVGVLVWGPRSCVPESYNVIVDFIDGKEIKYTNEWREYYIYYEDDKSENNIFLVQLGIRKT